MSVRRVTGGLLLALVYLLLLPEIASADVAVAVLVGAAIVAAVVPPWPRTGLRVRSLPGAAVSAVALAGLVGADVNGLLATLSPGTLLVDIDEERGVLLFHVAGAERDAFERALGRMYDRQRRFLP